MCHLRFSKVVSSFGFRVSSSLPALHGRRSRDKQFGEFVDRCCLQPRSIEAKLHDRRALVGREARSEIGFEFFYQKRQSLRASLVSADGVIECDLLRALYFLKKGLYRVGNGAFFRIEVVFCVLRIFDTDHLLTERIDAWIFCRGLLVVIRGERAEYQPDGGHILNAMIAVRGVVERTLLV